MANNYKKIMKCMQGRCRTCPYLEECNYFMSKITNVKFQPILNSCRSLNCITENVVYLISCKLCDLQYIGETKNSIQKRFAGHRSLISSGNSNQLIHNHFHKENHDLCNCQIIPIEKIEAAGLNEKELTRMRLDREKFWTQTLQTSYPLGMNVRMKGVGDFHPSQNIYRDFGGRRRRNRRRHNKRKPRSQRPIHQASVAYVMTQHEALKNSSSYMHFFKTYLYGLPRKQLLELWNEVRLPNDQTEVRIKDMIRMIGHLCLFKPVKTTEAKRRDYYHLKFIDKGLDFINISGILRSPSVVSKIPSYFQDTDPPIVGYRYNPSIAGLIFNYKQALDPVVINSTNTMNIDCDCQNSAYKNNHHNHVITGNLDIVQNEALKDIMKKGPKYRLPRKVNWTKNRENLVTFLEEYSEKWIKKERKASEDKNLNVSCLNAWKIEIVRLIDKRIESGKEKINFFKSLYIEGSLKKELDRLHDLFVITPADKAQNNMIFTCRPFYIKKVREELSANGTYHLTNKTFEDIMRDTCKFSSDMGVEVNEASKQLPLIYWIPKMHKNPTSERFIAGSKICAIKQLSKLFSKCLKLINCHLKSYNNVVFDRSGLKYYWIIDNSLDFLDHITNIKTDHLETFDFSTLYTSLPHIKIKQEFKCLFKKIYGREGKEFINVNWNKAYFSSVKNRNFHSFTEKNLVQILDFILNNIYVKFGEHIYKQVIGIPIGLDSGQDIANLLLYQYESSYVENVSKRDLNLAKKFSTSERYIDDLFSADFPDFKTHLPLIYPPELVVNDSSDSVKTVNYLDITITSDNFSNLTFSIFDKRDDFNFNIVNFPYLDSCIPRKPALGIFLSQLIRYARICSKFEDFSIRALTLSKRLQNQGYKVLELRKLVVRFFHERGSLLERYGERDINRFISKTLYAVS